jgi:hypothetical protein
MSNINYRKRDCYGNDAAEIFWLLNTEKQLKGKSRIEAWKE